ncbi:MAG: tetratricopeptide repeat protein, partial [Candidatus Marinimicrobia bacterium]|nr:tetratricopeptide repeat protein [Candidatus Neomarinimicrobiota bacterium]
LTDAVALNPLYSQAHNDLGVLYHRDGDPDRALGHLTLATQLDPDAADTARNLAEVYVEVGRTEDAIQIYLRLIKRHPNDLDALLWLAVAATKLGQKPQATVFLQRVLENQPGHQAAKDMLAGL